MQTVLETKNVIKNYRKTKAVRNLSIKLEENTIYGLLGRNGAGKTTLLNLLTGHKFPDSGEIKGFGKTLNKGDSLQEICYIKDNHQFFEESKVIQLLNFAAPFYEHWDWNFANELLRQFELDPNKKFKKLSRGMKSTVGIMIGLASRAPITIFDEPLLGLDAVMREKFYDILLKDYAEHPRTILMSTHLIDEISKVVEKVMILETGSIKLFDDMDTIRNKSYFVSGKSDVVESILKHKNVIHKDQHGKITIAAVFNTMSKQEIMEAEELELSVEGMSLQKFFSYYCMGGDKHE
ncbi:ABC transporter ATP-binding protein [Chengkuizengella axinellae]|uniref:ABC transporter ATP-binding protein n=1 Tax=Chengkuizengella axinellae TaxID=3064388 RepID=A0ABT9J1G6_9BACL|nr:ABC transporter ATP-binding protein [Chengkuizengella sp. 2205SS18-9]MDP5275323.1 ABC transporter ATP-binding protein [Chengkuizengella sp. 2205SS18-9]